MNRFFKQFWAVLTLALFLSACGSNSGVPNTNVDYPWSNPWQLVWEDHFEESSLDTASWTAMNRGLSWNNELQAYVEQNVSIEPSTIDLNRSCLVLTSKIENWTGLSNRSDNPNIIVTRNYTSGLVDTQNKRYWTYCKVEICARLPKTKGIWPAHWMLPNDGSWPPEIDIMELLGHDPKTVHMTNHWGTQQQHRFIGDHYTGPDFSAGFHIFSVEWEPGIVRWYVDGVKRFESTQGVPNKPFFLILNTAVGGDWPGNPDISTVFPQRHEIDWVKVYRK